jgi:hypothetical protein
MTTIEAVKRTFSSNALDCTQKLHVIFTQKWGRSQEKPEGEIALFQRIF